MKISWSGRHAEKWNQIFTLIAALQLSQGAIWMTCSAQHMVPHTVPHKPTHTHTHFANTPQHTVMLPIHLHMEAYKVHRLTLMNANIKKHTILWKNKTLLAGSTAVKVWIKWGVPFDPLMMTECSSFTSSVKMGSTRRLAWSVFVCIETKRAKYAQRSTNKQLLQWLTWHFSGVGFL